jgi:Phage integrase family
MWPLPGRAMHDLLAEGATGPGVVPVRRVRTTRRDGSGNGSPSVPARAGLPAEAASAASGREGWRSRHIPLTVRLTDALRAHRHLRSARALCRSDGSPLSRQVVQYYVKRAARRANVRNDGVHVLRHTFCSHLAMRGAPARAIQELAGHSDLSMTQRYMHVSPAAIESAIRLLDRPTAASVVEK